MPVINRIQVRRDSEADWASANPVLSQGEPGFETDTGKFKWGDGTTAWNSLDYAAGSASVVVSETAPVDVEVGGIWYNSAEGRAYIYYDSYFVELTPAIAGPPGKFSVSETEPADPVTGDAWFDASTAKLFLYYDSYWVEATGNYIGPEGPQGPAGPTGPAGADAQTPAGNAIINGAFDFWQRGTTFSNPSNGAYTADRFGILWDGTGATRTVSQQAFTPGTAPVAGYEAANFLRVAQTVAGSGATYQIIGQKIEDARTFANQQVTFSFFAKADAPRTLTLQFHREYGSGGSSAEFSILPSAPSFSVTTSWARYTATVTVPSVAGKTIGAGSLVWPHLNLPFNTTQTIDIWGVQLEAGSSATPFRRNANSLQGELAACQRYYYRQNLPNNQAAGSGAATSTTAAAIHIIPKVTMRVSPTSVEFATLNISDGVATFPSVTGLTFAAAKEDFTALTATVASGLTQFRPQVIAGNGAGAFLALNAEL